MGGGAVVGGGPVVLDGTVVVVTWTVVEVPLAQTCHQNVMA